MEIKKSRKASLENKKKSIFLFGLLTSLGMLLMAFEWANYEVNYEIPTQEYGELVITEPAIIPFDIIKPEPPSKPKPQEKINEDVVVTDVEDPIEEIDSLEVFDEGETNDNLLTEINLSDDFDDEKTTVIPPPFFTIVQEMPSFVGGEIELFKYLGSKIKYTSFARDAGVQGKIYVQFVVEEDGSITNVKTLNSLDSGLEKNAIKTIKEMKKWNPGKQRGKTVRVQIKIPISYKLN